MSAKAKSSQRTAVASNSYRYGTSNGIKIIPVSCIQKNLLNFAQNECTGATPPSPPSPDPCAKLGPNWHMSKIVHFCVQGPPPKAPEPTCSDLKKSLKEKSDRIKAIDSKQEQLDAQAKALVKPILNLKRNIFEIEQTIEDLKGIFSQEDLDKTYKGPEYFKEKADLKSMQDQLNSLLAQEKKLDKERTNLVKQYLDQSQANKSKGCPSV